MCERVYSGFPHVKYRLAQVNFKFDDNSFKGPESFNSLKDYLVGKARLSGFNLISEKRSTSRKTSRSKYQLATLDLVCDHNRTPMSQLGIKPSSTSILSSQESPSQESHTKTSRKVTTTRPSTSCTRCSFRIRAFCYNEDQCWYLLSNYPSYVNPSIHTGHLQLRPQDMKASYTELEEEQIQLAITCSECQLDNNVIASLINKMNHKSGCGKFSPAQIRYAIDRAKAEALLGSFQEKRTSAEQLIDGFDRLINQGSKIKYIALLHDCSDGYLLKLPKGRPTKQSVNGTNMQVRSTQKVLLAFSFITEEEIRLVKKFPTVITFDVTEKTNKEKRGLFVGTGLDGLGKIFIAVHCFMPNSQMSSYGWVYRTAIPLLWGDNIVRRVKVVITDGEHALYAPLENLSGTGGPWNGVSVQR